MSLTIKLPRLEAYKSSAKYLKVHEMFLLLEL